MGWQLRRHPERVKGFRVPVPVLEQLLVANRKQRATQRREDRQLVIWPFDRRKRRAQRFDLLAPVKRAAADQQMVDAARFERVDVSARDVGTETDEAPEQQTHMSRPHGNRRRAMTLGHLPSAIVNQPRSEEHTSELQSLAY